MSISAALVEQYDRAWEMLRATIDRFDDQAWRTGEAPGLVPARYAYHAIEAVEFYMRPAMEGFPWARRFGVDWGADAERLPSRAEILGYLADVQASTRAYLAGLADDDLLTASNPFHWTGETVLDRILYALRHTMTHQGEMSMLLRLAGAEETEWR